MVFGTTSIRLAIYMGYYDEAKYYVDILYDLANRHITLSEDRPNTRYTLIFCEHALATGQAGNPRDAMNAIGAIHDRLVATGVRWYLRGCIDVGGDC